MPTKFDYGVFIGRFQPLHVGHTHIIDEALKQASKLIVVIGSAGEARTIKNPFTFEERKAVIESAYRYQVRTGRLIIIGQSNVADDDVDWADQVEEQVMNIVVEGQGNDVEKTIALAGYGKDASSYYLKLFPNWPSIQIETQKGTLNSTDIRKAYFKSMPVWPRDVMPEAANAFLDEFRWTETFKALVADAKYYKPYPKTYGPGPFLTGDSIIVHRGEVLLVTRGKVPGKGQLAMPGGFRNLYERLEDCALRELREETGLDLKRHAWIDYSYMVDTPYRSLRGDVLTWVIAAVLPAEFDRSTLKASDDAAALGWYRFDTLSPDQFFDDHWSILNSHFINHNMETAD